ncbi:MAG: PHP domain-containing protein [Candidatus Thorarchaeota archaeon]
MSTIAKREVIFLDGLAGVYPGEDVSTDYLSIIPPFRYFIEPFAGVAFIVGYDFEWAIAFTLLYLIYRIIYLILKKTNKVKTDKFKRLKRPFYNFMSFVFKVFSITLVVIGIIMLIGSSIMGYYFVSRYFMVIVQLGIRVCVLFLVIKISQLVIIIFHPKLKFRKFSKKTRSKRKRKSKILKYSSRLKTELIFMVGALYLLLGANILLISTHFPTHRIYTELDDDEFLFDFHVHTIMSDGWITPEERVKWYIEQGITGAVFTDHDNIRGALLARKYVEESGLSFIVFIGEEWTDNANDIHMNYFGIEEKIVPPMSNTPYGNPLVLNASDMIKYVKSNGGYVTVNHYNYDPNPNGGFGVPYTLEQLSEWGVDGFEIINGDDVQDYGIREYCLNNTNGYNESLICLGGSDIHTGQELNAFLKIKLDNPANKSIDNIFQNLRKNEHQVITINLHSNLVDFPGDLNILGFKMLEDFLNYLLNLNSLQIISWIGWSCLLYAVIFLVHRKIKLH